MLFAVALLAVLPAATDPYANLDFHTGSLTQWQGQGFYLTTATGHGPSLSFAVCSSDCGPKGRKGQLVRTIIVPPDVSSLRFAPAPSGAAIAAPTIVSMSYSKRRSGELFPNRSAPATSGKQPAPAAIQRWQAARISSGTSPTLPDRRCASSSSITTTGPAALCSVPASAAVRHQEPLGGEFATTMRKLEREHKLSPMVRLDSQHFLAIGNADDEFIEDCLGNCETLYSVFFEHFRKKGFTVRQPKGRLMVAVFDTQAGFEAYLGQKMSTSIRGIYHPQTNRLVVYDYGQNRDFLDAKTHGERESRRLASSLDRQRVISSFNRRVQDYRTDANIGTVMHETAHQLSFNSGLLNRNGDVPAWLAEGLACYCEATSNGAWQGIAQPNVSRATTLRTALKQKGSLLTLRQLVENDDCLRKAATVNQVVARLRAELGAVPPAHGGTTEGFEEVSGADLLRGSAGTTTRGFHGSVRHRSRQVGKALSGIPAGYGGVSRTTGEVTRQGDKETRGQGDKGQGTGTRRQGARGQGDKGTSVFSPCLPVPLSPCLRSIEIGWAASFNGGHSFSMPSSSIFFTSSSVISYCWLICCRDSATLMPMSWLVTNS